MDSEVYLPDYYRVLVPVVLAVLPEAGGRILHSSSAGPFLPNLKAIA